MSALVWARIEQFIGAIWCAVGLGGLLGMYILSLRRRGPVDRSRPFRGSRRRHDGIAKLLGRGD